MQCLGAFFVCCFVVGFFLFKSRGISWKIRISVHGYGCVLADFSCYVKMHAKYLKCDLALEQWVFLLFFLGSSRKYFIFLILKEEKGEIKRSSLFSSLCWAVAAFCCSYTRMTFANNLSDFVFVPHSCVTSSNDGLKLQQYL